MTNSSLRRLQTGCLLLIKAGLLSCPYKAAVTLLSRGGLLFKLEDFDGEGELKFMDRRVVLLRELLPLALVELRRLLHKLGSQRGILDMTVQAITRMTRKVACSSSLYLCFYKGSLLFAHGTLDTPVTVLAESLSVSRKYTYGRVLKALNICCEEASALEFSFNKSQLLMLSHSLLSKEGDFL
jgi:hypothetical protein